MTLAREAALALSAFAELGAPSVCGCCGTPGEGLCADCRRRVGEGWFRAGPRVVGRADGVPVRAAGAYDGALAAVLRAYKDGHRRDLAEVLAPGLLAAVLACVEAAPALVPAPRWVLVPAPSARSADRRRGDNPTAALARLAARSAGACIGNGASDTGGTDDGCRVDVVRLLGVRRRVADQAALGRAGRAANVDHAFAVRSERLLASCAGARVLVVDDVATTGATARECVRALREAGLSVAGVACALATLPRGPTGPP